MPLFPLPVEEFGGLNLVDAVDEVGFAGAIDALNIDLDRRGQVRSRNGTVDWSTAGSNTPQRLAPFYRTSGSAQLLALDIDNTGHPVWRAYDNTGTLLSTSVIASITAFGGMAVRYGTSGAEEAYLSRGNGASVIKWDGSAFSTPAYTATTPAGQLLAVQHSDDRLVNARYTGNTLGNNPSTVRFSDAGNPLSFLANNFVDLDPGDGESITGMVSWRELVFVFKHSKFFVFYGTETDPTTGNPIFKYRPVVGQGRDVSFAAGNDHNPSFCVAPEGVYFASQRGIWLTTGGPPTLVSSPVQPIFRGQGASAFWQNGYYDPTQSAPVALHYHDNRLYIAYSTGASPGITDKTLVYDPRAGTWTIWDLAPGAMCSFIPSGQTSEQLMFSRWTNKKIAYLSSTAIDDAGTAITSRYQSGFDNIAPPRRFAAHYLFGNTRKRLRKWKVTGTGTVNFNVAHDFNAMAGADQQTLALGAAPAIADGWYNVAKRGQLFSYQIAATSPFVAQKLTSYLAGSEPPLLGNPADK